MLKKRGQINIMPPQGQSGFSGYSGFSGKSGFSGLSGYSGATGPMGPAGPAGGGGGSTTPTPDNIVITGSLTTGSQGGASGDVALSGAASGAVHLRAQNDAGTGIFLFPVTTGVQTLATLADLEALYQKLTNP